MSEKYDVVVAGAGHNGLLVAGYLAKAGMNVCVVEKQSYVGGGVTTVEVAAPGFKNDLCSVWHGFIQPNPVLRDDELDLFSKYGLEYIFPEKQNVVLFPDDRYLTFYRDLDKTCESIAKFSEKDAVAYRKFYDWSVQTLDMMTTGMYNPPAAFGPFVAMLDQSKEGRSLLRSMLVSALDICEEWFESDELKIALTRFASEGMIKPQTKGTGLVLFIFIPLMHKYGGALGVGGSGALSWAIERCIKDHGGTVMLDAPVKEFKIEGGKCTGVILESGDEIIGTKAVVTNFNVKQVFPDMVKGASLEEDFVDGVDKIAFSDYMALNQAFALNDAPKFTAGPDVDDSMWVEFSPSSLEEYLKSFDEMSYGYPATKFPLSICATIYDKTRAPEGKHTLYLYQYEPYDLKGGAQRWDEIGQEVADGILDTLRNQTTNMGDENIIGRWMHNPLDYERYNPSWIKGDFTHFGSHIWQFQGNRPLPGWSHYRTPVDKLYLCGPSTHPGMGVVGAGRAAVQVVMEDLGLDFEKVVSK